MRNFYILLFTILYCNMGMAQTPQIWQDYLADKSEGKTPELTDYSFAGYHFSEAPIPSVTGWAYFDVTAYGAIANDELYDDDAIQMAINAAQESNGPAVVFFPPGKFIVSSDNDINKKISISSDSIVLKGSGSGEGGTEIFMDEKRVLNGHWEFTIEPENTARTLLTVMQGSAKMGDYSILVENSDLLEAGMVICLYHKSEEFARAHFGELELSPEWSRLFGVSGGMTLFELHEIAHISGNLVRFKNPVQTDLPELPEKYQLTSLPVIHEVGVEDILFTSGWEDYPEEFVHHKNDIHDYAWNAVQFNNVQNGWVRNCEFRSWNQDLDIRQSIGVTVENVLISGKKGHASVLTRRGYGLLVKDCEDQAGQHHGPGTGYSGVNTVYLRYKMLEDQSFDAHSGQPYATLMDDVQGGVFNKNGGPYESYPHHARYLTFWNFRHQSSGNISYDFWSVNSRNGNTYADPYFVGFQHNKSVNFQNEGLNQMEGEMVEPRSLFDAQLNLRLEQQKTQPQVSFISPGNGQERPIGSDVSVEVSASDPDGTITSVSLYLNGDEQRIINASPFIWGEDVADDPLFFNMPAGQYMLEAIAKDNDGNTTSAFIHFTVGKAPTIEILSPAKDAIIETGNPLVVEASVNDEDGIISNVQLYLDDGFVREITQSPFIWGEDSQLDPKLFNLPSGSHTIKVIAMDDDGLLDSTTVAITYNDPPDVSFKNPTDGQSFEFGANVPVEVSAVDNDGDIELLELYINDEFFREEINPPYTWGINPDLDPGLFNIASGTYALRVVVTDDLGTESSTTISITVEETPVLALNELGTDDFLIYPNPTTNVLVIDTQAMVTSFWLMDAIGKIQPYEVLKQSDKVIKIDTSSLTGGIYFLTIATSAGQKYFKILKE